MNTVSFIEISESGLVITFDCDRSTETKMSKSTRLQELHDATTDRVAFEAYGLNDLAAKRNIMTEKHEARLPTLMEFAYHIHSGPPRINRNLGFDMPDHLFHLSECICQFLIPMSWEVE